MAGLTESVLQGMLDGLVNSSPRYQKVSGWGRPVPSRTSQNLRCATSWHFDENASMGTDVLLAIERVISALKSTSPRIGVQRSQNTSPCRGWEYPTDLSLSRCHHISDLDI
jgi:hypothetical protein